MHINHRRKVGSHSCKREGQGRGFLTIYSMKPMKQFWARYERRVTRNLIKKFEYTEASFHRQKHKRIIWDYW